MVGKEAEFLKIGPKLPPPYGIKIFKGYKNVILRRDMVSFMINHPVAISFREYVQDIKIPDEHFYATIIRIDNIEPMNKYFNLYSSILFTILMVLRSLFFISNVANFKLVSGFQLYTVVACVGCLASRKDTSPVACITFLIIKFMS